MILAFLKVYLYPLTDSRTLTGVKTQLNSWENAVPAPGRKGSLTKVLQDVANMSGRTGGTYLRMGLRILAHK